MMLDLIILVLLFAELEFIEYNFIFFSTMNYFYLERIIMFFIEKNNDYRYHKCRSIGSC
jgi:hypothetical protein